MNKKLWAINIALLSSLACAEATTWTSKCANGFEQIMDSDHFTVCAYYYSSFIDTSKVRNTLTFLEDVFDFYHDSLEWMLPQPSSPNYKIKNNLYLYRDEVLDYLFGGGDGEACINKECSAGIWISVSNLGFENGLAHEYAHGLQSFAGDIGDGSFAGWFVETHANWTMHQFFPDRVSDGGEDVIDFPYLHYGTNRENYTSWHFLEHLKEKFGGGLKGAQKVNEIWTKSIRPNQAGWAEQTPFDAMINVFPNWNLDSLNNEFGRFAMKQATLEYEPKHKEIYRAKWGDYEFSTRRGDGYERPYGAHARVTMLNRIDSVENRYISPSYWAPQRWGYNLVRIFPDTVGRVKVRFRGIVQEEKTVNGYNCYELACITNNSVWCRYSPSVIPNPASGWRVGLVAEGDDGTPRYSEMKSGTAFNLDIETRADDKALWLAIAATPTEMQKILSDQFYYSIYRYPYMIQVDNGKPEGYNKNFWVPADTTNYRRHENGGGFVYKKAHVEPSVYVGPNAVVNGGKLAGNVRVEDFAVINGGTFDANVIVRGRAMVSSGYIRENTIIEDDAWVVSGNISGNSKIGALSVIHNSTIKDDAQIYTVFKPLDGLKVSGSTQLRGDFEPDPYAPVTTYTKGVFYGSVDTTNVKKSYFGVNLTEPMIEATASIENAEWYRIYEDYYRVQKPIIASISPAQNTNLKTIDETFQVFDLKGKRLGSVNMTQGVSLNETLRAAGFNSGLYLVRGKNTHKMHRINVR